MTKANRKMNQIAPHKENTAVIVSPTGTSDDLRQWAEWYFEHEVTTAESSQYAQRSDLELFFRYMDSEIGNTLCKNWTPRTAKNFREFMQNTYEDGHRRWKDSSINRTSAHLNTFAKWVHKHHPFTLDNPMRKIKELSTGTRLNIERAITEAERNRILDAADQLLIVGGLSTDRRRGGTRKLQRSTYRPYRNRAIMYTFTETGMRRVGLKNINLPEIDFANREITTREKGGSLKTYKISKEGMAAIQDYLDHERSTDDDKWQSPALFLSPHSNPHGFRKNPADNGRLNTKTINNIWKEVCKVAGVSDRTPHSARHGMGVFLTNKKGLSAAGRQLQHSNNTYTLEYARVTNQELQDALDER